jgi:signal transduction histidine kinase
MSGWDKAIVGRMATWEIHLPARRVYFTEAMSRLLDLERASTACPLDDYLGLVHPEDRSCVKTAIESSFADTPMLRHRLVRQGRKPAWVAMHGGIVRTYRGKNILGGVIFEIDPAESQRIADDIEGQYVSDYQRATRPGRGSAGNLPLAAKLVEAQQRERQRLASLLHDHVQQLLVAVKFNLRAAQRQKPDDKTVPMIHKSCLLLDEALSLCRSLAAEMDPPIVRQGDLKASLDWLAHSMEEKHYLKTQLRFGLSRDVGQNVRLLVFETVRELLFNVVKHAGVKRATVRVSVTPKGLLRVCVADRGRGFDVSSLDSRCECLGLARIRQRIELAGGEISVVSRIGCGATITVLIPLAPQA